MSSIGAERPAQTRPPGPQQQADAAAPPLEESMPRATKAPLVVLVVLFVACLVALAVTVLGRP